MRGFLGGCLVAWTALMASGAELTLPVAPYRSGLWDMRALNAGHHRAVVEVAEQADAVFVRVPWRRRDAKPEEKAVLAFFADGRPAPNIVARRLDGECGEFVFQPVHGPGTYYLFYLPFPAPLAWYSSVSYFRPRPPADAAWGERARAAAPDSLPEARLVALEALDDFNRFDPMEVCATRAETETLRATCPPGRVFMVFPEERMRSIRMTDALPVDWITRGERLDIALTARPGENLAWQLGVWAARGGVSDLRVRWSDFIGPDGAIPAAVISCLNTEGVDYRGRPMEKSIALADDEVRPLWFFLTVPDDAAGPYDGVLTLSDGGVAIEVRVRLAVAGDALPDGGIDAPERMTRLTWFNSRAGQDERVLAPYTPLRTNGDAVEILGRSLAFGSDGLPVSIRSNGRELLRAPVSFALTTERGVLAFDRWTMEESDASDLGRTRRHVARRPEGELTMESRLEYDGWLNYVVTFRAARDMALADARLTTDVARREAPYAMGFGRKGGVRPERLDWRWEPSKASNRLWLGGMEAGLQLFLTPAREGFWSNGTLYENGLPDGWHNGGAGGANLREAGDAVRITAFSGARRLKAGETATFGFAYFVTPFKPVDWRRHWATRRGSWMGVPGCNVRTLFHGVSGNKYINYPFWDEAETHEIVRQLKNNLRNADCAEYGHLRYPGAGGVTSDRGRFAFDLRVDMDPREGRAGNPLFNFPLCRVNYSNGDQINLFWCVDPRGFRLNFRRGEGEAAQYPVSFDVPLADWRPGETHRVEAVWADGRARILIDGEERAARPFTPGWSDARPEDGVAELGSRGFALRRAAVGDVDDDMGARTIAGQKTGRVDRRDGWATFGRLSTMDVELYYTMRDISNRAYELWPMRALGGEILAPSAFVYSIHGAKRVAVDGGGYPWLIEHLGRGYVPGWLQPLDGNTIKGPLNQVDAAIGTLGHSRLANYYIESVPYLMKKYGLRGIYLDGIGFDRYVMRRLARVMADVRPDYLINYHTMNSFDFSRSESSSLNHAMEHLPFLTDVWLGEMVDYDQPPAYWLVELSGLPFGLTGEQLNGSDGGNFFRGMLYGMNWRREGAGARGTSAVWRLWDDFGIEDAEVMGYWRDDAPARVDHPDVRATTYRRDDRALVVVAHWPNIPDKAVRATATTRPPVVDGVLDDAAWRNAANIRHFYEMNTSRPARHPMSFYLTFDRKRLYFAFRCPGGTPPRADATARDGQLWLDDSVDFFLAQNAMDDPQRNIHFIGNAAGAVYDARAGDAAWNGDWTYATKVAPDGWTGEASITLNALGLRYGDLVAGGRWGLNVGRTCHADAPASTSAYTKTHGRYDSKLAALAFATAGKATREEPVAEDDVSCRLSLDWDALGLDPARTRVFLPELADIQAERPVDLAEPLRFEAAKGAFLWLENRGQP